MKMLWWFMIDAPHYLLASTVAHLTNVFGFPWCWDRQNKVSRFGRFVFHMTSDWVHWDDPWVQYQRWAKRGYDMEWTLK
jgi:hypothetical protein